MKTKQIKLQIPAGKANPAPPVGPALGQHGLNIGDFIKQFNDRTKDMDAGVPVPVLISVGPNRTFTFEVKDPPVSYMILQAAKLQKGSSAPGRDAAGVITKAQVREIALKKMKDMNVDSVESAELSVAGSARSAGIKVVD